MIPVRWFPSTKSAEGSKGLERLFSDFLDFDPYDRYHAWAASNLDSDVTVPSIEITESKDAYIIRAELPGVGKDDIDLTITEDVLKIKAETKGGSAGDEECYCSERASGKFLRTIPLPGSVAGDKATASTKDGILEIRLPKKEEALAKEAKIKVA